VNHALNTIAGLDANNDFEGIQSFLIDSLRDVTDLVFAAGHFMLEERYQAAYLISKRLHGAGVHHPIAALAQAIGGILFDNPSDEVLGCSHLASLVNGFTPGQQATFFNKILKPVTFKLTDWHFSRHRVAELLRVLEVIKAGTPVLRDVFDLNAEVKPFDLEKQVRSAKERSRLIDYISPPAGAPRQPRRVIVAMRELWFPNDLNSRPMDIGPRVTEAMNIYGWRATHFGLKCRAWLDDFAGLRECCRQEKPEILFFDDQLVQVPELRGLRNAIISTLRQDMPDLKIVGFHADPWEIEASVIRDTAPSLDALWVGIPALPVWDEPAIRHKVLHVPLPAAGNAFDIAEPLPSRATFAGGIKGYNLHRVYWLAATTARRLPIDWELSSHKADGLSALDSYAAFMRRVAAKGCAVNFSMRPDLSRVITGRAFEAIIAGALLITETAPDMDYLFTAGEHYLEFSKFSELSAIMQFIADHPDEAERVRRQGNKFARERYSDEKLIGYLDGLLYYSGADAGAQSQPAGGTVAHSISAL
jgi:hypothetical protein